MLSSTVFEPLTLFLSFLFRPVYRSVCLRLGTAIDISLVWLIKDTNLLEKFINASSSANISPNTFLIVTFTKSGSLNLLRIVALYIPASVPNPLTSSMFLVKNVAISSSANPNNDLSCIAPSNLSRSS